MNNKIVEIKNVKKKVRGRTLIDNLSFTVEAGEKCGLLGPNGAGKTTLIRMLTGLIQPTKGEIKVCGNNIQTERTAALHEVGAIVEAPIFFPYMTGKENLQNLARLHPNLSKSERKQRVQEVIEIVGLAGREKDKVRTYSMGMKQRLGIAQAILGNPKFLILDEPTNGLDPIGIRELRELIQKLHKEMDITILVSSHMLDELQKICNSFVIIKNGRFIWNGTKEELLAINSSVEDAFVELVTR